MSTAQPHDPKAPITATTNAPEAAGPDQSDDLIVAPGGKHKTRFLMTFLLVIILLTTFSVTGPLMTALTGGEMPGKGFLSWEVGGQAREIDAQDFYNEKRRLAPIGGFLFGIGDGRAVSNEEAARFIVIDSVAEHSGVRVTDDELVKFVERSFPAGPAGSTKEQYSAFLKAYRTTAKDFESIVRRGLRYARYQQLMSAGLSVPDMAAVEKAWRGQHQEYRLVGGRLAVADLVAEARAQAPQGADLQAWFDLLTPIEKDAYRTQDAASAELAVFPHQDSAVTGVELYAKYPPAADANDEAVAREYHQNFGITRFRRTSFEGMTPSIENLVLPFDEVKDAAMKEGKAYKAMSAWIADMNERAGKGEAVDFAAEAATLGLAFRTQTEVLTFDSWNALSLPFASRYAFEAILAAQAPGTLPNVVVDQKGLVVAKVLQKNAAAMPPFDQLSERVAEAWAKKKAGELAVARLDAVRERFLVANADGTKGPKAEVEESDFIAALGETKAEIVERDWAERSTPPKDTDTPFDVWLRGNFTIWTQTEKTVAKSELDRDGANAWIVRASGVRDPQLSRMSPGDVSSLGRNNWFMERGMFTEQQVSGKLALEERYKFKLSAEAGE
jgi:hypothetical protein